MTHTPATRLSCQQPANGLALCVRAGHRTPAGVLVGHHQTKLAGPVKGQTVPFSASRPATVATGIRVATATQAATRHRGFRHGAVHDRSRQTPHSRRPGSGAVGPGRRGHRPQTQVLGRLAARLHQLLGILG